MLKRITHIVLALLLLISATGMTVSLHYCNHALYDIGIFTPADNCCLLDENMEGPAEHDHCAAGIHQKDQCEDDIITVNSVDDFLSSTSGSDYNVQYTYLLPSFELLSSGLCLKPNSSRLEEIPEHDNAPPGVTSEPSFLQSFLI